MTWRSRLTTAALVVTIVGLPLRAIAADSSDDQPSGAPASLAGSITLVPFEDPMFDITSVAPDGWTLIGPGTRARGEPPEDLALIALQTAPVGSDLLWKALLPQLFLTEVPPATDERHTTGFDWTIYDVVTEVGATKVAVAVALAETDGSTSLVILQATPAEMATLREAVLLPALDAFGIILPEPTPDPATFGYHVEEVSFPGGSEGVQLAGTLTLPAGVGPYPVIVLMSGSGPQDRNESTRPAATIEPFALIADALTRAGVGVLRYDDRGVGGSTGDYSTASIADLTEDGRAALTYLTTRDDVDASRIGVLGHSEGGLYAASLAADDPRVAFVVVMAPPAVDGTTLIVEQNAAVARTSGLSEAEVAASMDVFSRICPAAVAGDLDLVEAILREATEAYWDRQTAEFRAALGDREVFIERQMALQLPSVTSDGFRGICASDPAADWSRVTAPILALFGAHDVQVLADSNSAALRDALAVAGDDDVTIVTFPDANHLFQASETGALQEYPTLPDTFSPDVLPTIVDWLTARVVTSEDAGRSPTPAP